MNDFIQDDRDEGQLARDRFDEPGGNLAALARIESKPPAVPYVWVIGPDYDLWVPADQVQATRERMAREARDKDYMLERRGHSDECE